MPPQCHVQLDSYQTKCLNGFMRLQNEEEFVDMTLAAEGHLVKVHKNIMAVASPFIKELLKSAPCSHPVIFLTDVKKNMLAYILEYVYTGEVQVPTFEMSTFVKTAKAMHIVGIKDLIPPKCSASHQSWATNEISKMNDKKRRRDADKHLTYDTETENDEAVNSLQANNIVFRNTTDITEAENDEAAKHQANNIVFRNTTNIIKAENDEAAEHQENNIVFRNATNIIAANNDNAHPYQANNIVFRNATNIIAADNDDAHSYQANNIVFRNATNIIKAENDEAAKHQENNIVFRNATNIIAANNDNAHPYQANNNVFRNNNNIVKAENGHAHAYQANNVVLRNNTNIIAADNDDLHPYQANNIAFRNITNISEAFNDKAHWFEANNIVLRNNTNMNAADNDDLKPYQTNNIVLRNPHNGIDKECDKSNEPLRQEQRDKNYENETNTSLGKLVSSLGLKDLNESNVINDDNLCKMTTMFISNDQSINTITEQTTKNSVNNDYMIKEEANVDEQAMTSMVETNPNMDPNFMDVEANINQQAPTEYRFEVDSLNSDAKGKQMEITIKPLNIHETENGNVKPTDVCTTPLYSISTRGRLMLILNRYVYNLHNSAEHKGTRRFRCIEYYSRKKPCKAYVDTEHDVVTNRKAMHIHPFHDEKIMQKGQEGRIYSSAKDALSAVENNDMIMFSDVE